jgi:hypothetical protein
MRLRGRMRKEAFQILRDPSSIAIAFVMPLVLLLLFDCALDGRNSNTAMLALNYVQHIVIDYNIAWAERPREPSALVQVQPLGPSSSMG